MKTVLHYVQSALSIMDSDEVDGIEETEEATQVAELLKDVYYELINRQNWDYLSRPTNIIASGDLTTPTKFVVQDNLKHLDKLWYNVGKDSVERREIEYVKPQEFISMTTRNGDNKQLVGYGNQIQFFVFNDRQPTMYTSFDDYTIWCDSFDSSVDETLTSSKVSGWGTIIPDFEVTNDFVPDIPEHMIPLLQAELNSAASIHFKQQVSKPDERRAERQLSRARLQDSRVTPKTGYYLFNFGRR